MLNRKIWEFGVIVDGTVFDDKFQGVALGIGDWGGVKVSGGWDLRTKDPAFKWDDDNIAEVRMKVKSILGINIMKKWAEQSREMRS